MEFLQQVANALTQGAIYALIALGYTLVYGVLRLINFAHGDVYMLGAFFGLFISRWTGALTLSQNNKSVPLWMTAVVFVGAMIGSALVGMVIERFAYRPLRTAPRLTALITAIGVSLLLEYGGQMAFSPDPQPFAALIAERNIIDTPSFSLSLVQLFIVGAALLLMLSLNFLIQKTKIGRAMRAVSIDRAAAQLMGIPTDRIIAFTFALGSGLAAAAGVLNSIYQPSIDPLMGVQVGLRAFVAAVLGGIGNIYGAVLGGLLMAFAETATVAVGLSRYRDAVAFAILILVLLVRPAGILGRNVAEKV
ncbi:high-affinity branched-chain amino acid transport system permease protein LivH [Abditibacteriota bacterium]|nr:high-affinity branched-chain amino acid transport system permease protein LivH [Abditibacteriota bacterium]